MGFDSVNVSPMPSLRMTKYQLRDALQEANIKVPSKIRKEDLVKLYQKHISDVEVSATSAGINSDEEDMQDDTIESLDTSHITSKTDVKQLSNDELFSKLKHLGAQVGPILGSTREVYERKLSILLQNERDDDEKAAFSADEEDKDETDEYDLGGATGNKPEHFKSIGISEKQLNDGGFLKTTTNVHEKVEHNDGTVVRSRRAHTIKTYTNETPASNGKSFVPPPPTHDFPFWKYAILLAFFLIVCGGLYCVRPLQVAPYMPVPTAGGYQGSSGAPVDGGQPSPA